MENEFSRINLTCEGAYVVPRNPPGSTKYPDIVGPNQACTLYGSVPGSIIVKGGDYINAAYQLDTADLWRRNFIVMIGWFIFLQFTQVIAIEYFQVRGGTGSVCVFFFVNKHF
jgi:ATP-binding cassette subfamily G (WHITE) protein 2 (SNQ2)